MKFVLAPDSFKNALRSPEVCAALTDGIRMAQPEAEILAIPLADGGEGTVRAAALAAEGVLEQYETSGPLGAPLTAETARLPGGVAVVEMASAAGLELLSPDGCAPLEATTFGVGLLLRQLLDSGCRDFVMMQSSGRLRVVFVTTHIALAEVPRQVTSGRIATVTKLLDEVIRREGVPHPKLAAAAINPHAGENGCMGTEDETVTKPTLAALREQGIDIDGPFPPDTLFIESTRERYDGIVSMYHDQGHIPFKMLAFNSGVNSTLGLPIVRTSPDHGTAFDIAWRGVADPGSFYAAIDTAIRRA